MNRSEAIAVLKDMVASKVIDTSWVSLQKDNQDDYRLEMKTTSFDAIREFEAERGLAGEEDREKGICIIYKPPLT